MLKAKTAEPVAVKPRELDMGPIRIRDCRYVKNTSSTGQYILTLDIGDNAVEIITSTLGKNVYISLNDEKLTG